MAESSFWVKALNFREGSNFWESLQKKEKKALSLVNFCSSYRWKSVCVAFFFKEDQKENLLQQVGMNLLIVTGG